MTKIFICGMCRNKGKEVKTTRKGLRNHLKTEHLLTSGLTNAKPVMEGKVRYGTVKQNWWVTEEFN